MSLYKFNGYFAKQINPKEMFSTQIKATGKNLNILDWENIWGCGYGCHAKSDTLVRCDCEINWAYSLETTGWYSNSLI